MYTINLLSDVVKTNKWCCYKYKCITKENILYFISSFLSNFL